MSAARHDGNVWLPGGRVRMGRVGMEAGWRTGWGGKGGSLTGCGERCSDERRRTRRRRWSPRLSLAGGSVNGGISPPVWW